MEHAVISICFHRSEPSTEPRLIILARWISDSIHDSEEPKERSRTCVGNYFTES